MLLLLLPAVVFAAPLDVPGNPGYPPPLTTERDPGKGCCSTAGQVGRDVDAYTDAIAYFTDETVNLKIHIPARAIGFVVKIFRLGDDVSSLKVLHKGRGKRTYQIQRSDPTQPCPRGLYVGPQLADVVTEPTRGWESDLKWCDSYRFKLSDAHITSPGIYAAAITQLLDKGKLDDTFVVPIVVRGSRNVRPGIRYMASTVTWQAYNAWGGGGIYAQPDKERELFSNGDPLPGFTSTTHRPNLTTNVIRGPDHVAGGAAAIANWLRDHKYKFQIITDQDFHFDGTAMSGADTLILGPHPEYWSDEMYANLEGFIRRGGSILYLGGNGLYRTVRLNRDGGIQYMDYRERDGRGCVGRLLGVQGDPTHANWLIEKSSGKTHCAPANEDTRTKDFEWIWAGISKRRRASLGENTTYHVCAGGNPSGAFGHEVDRTNKYCLFEFGDSNVPYRNIVASAVNYSKGPSGMEVATTKDDTDPTKKTHELSEVVYNELREEFKRKKSDLKRKGAGVFSVGSIAFVGSLQAEPAVGCMVRNVLDRVGHPPSPEIRWNCDASALGGSGPVRQAH
jgi:hypothetical protein